ncbi:acyl-CoA dehydratase activase [Thermodesulforhabdus norvegica]|uniref:CoA-substrate-specific enzyme activase, putative n=1 Tax=Thermodesulforhabdus norvegica TaxID=39841 RepID=A0A1I4SK56_9BACT|nr:acyl-CoA dehydratase activase [Thermodesulforhabdus norvegica]SFM64761.1 CoA-substrate-specific enzyme activase, putative [Thermodesulforhabdus norvegica]
MYYLGLDIGSVSINGMVVDEEGNIVEELPYRRHFGLVFEHFKDVLSLVRERYGSTLVSVALTGMHGELIARILDLPFEAETIAQVVGTVYVVPGVRTIISMGGQDALLFQIGYDPGSDGRRWYLEDFEMNGPCASGTGSFIDQQAERLAYSMYDKSWKPSQEQLQRVLDDFIELGLKSTSPAPVACRCTVFTKSDMIHLQNKGEPLMNIIAGLHYGNAANFVSNIVGNRTVKDPVVFIGGMASNRLQVRAFRHYFPGITVPPYHTSMGALGVALIAIERGWRKLPSKDLSAITTMDYDFPRTGPLRLELSRFDEDNSLKVRKRKKWEGFLGIDIGSTTTKYAFIDRSGRLLHKCYVPTRGKPIEVVQYLLGVLLETTKGECRILGLATTGSGRNVVGDFVDADLIVDEITAHARGAVYMDPEVDTIFEIGGQDSKYIRIDRGHPVDFDMNKVCAAGTGSFLHELANKMNINIVGEFQEIAMASESPIHLTERCTVFMESDLAGYAQKGASREDLIAGLCYAVVHNYLNRVVGRRPVGRRVMFLGGPSLNKAVVAAFERVLNRPIIVPRHREVMGAYGAALLVREMYERGEVTPRQRDLKKLSEASVSFQEVICRADPKCHNECKLKVYDFVGRKSIWGGDCGRYEVSHGKEKETVNYIGKRNSLFFDLMSRWDVVPGRISAGKKGLPVIGMPLGLHFWEWAPFWVVIFRELGFPLLLSPQTTQDIARKGVESVTAETCFPVMVFHGHVRWLSQRVDMLFLPNVINMPSYSEKEAGFFCPLVESGQYITRFALNLDPARIVKPTVYLNDPPEYIADRIVEAMPGSLKPDRALLTRIVKKAFDVQLGFREELLKIGREVISRSNGEEPIWVISGRPYNLYDVRLNLQLGKQLARRGIKAITLDFVDLSLEDMSDFPRMYWGFGSRILRAAKHIARHEGLYGVHLTNFSCGPDSFIEHFYRHVLSEKPALVLEFDEHTAVAGVLTRVEAYNNVVKNYEFQRKSGNRQKMAM